MHIEEEMAARIIRADIVDGYSVKSATIKATKLLVSQGFSEEYAKRVSEKMADLV